MAELHATFVSNVNIASCNMDSFKGFPSSQLNIVQQYSLSQGDSASAVK